MLDLWQDIGSSITGSINKAMLFVKKNDSATGKTNIKLREELMMNTRHSLLENPGKSLRKSAKIADSKEQDGFHVMQVKYNPSSIKMSTKAGSYTQYSGVGAMGVNQVTQVTIPAETAMTVELVFDDMDILDAFMWEKYQLTLGSALSTGAGIVKQVAKEGYSVQAQIDGLVALITQAHSRFVLFYWSEMGFAGEVTNIQARYTMFNPQGHPVRGVVSLTIVQNEKVEGSSDNAYWEQAFENLFGDYSTNNDVTDSISKYTDMLGNIINI